MSSCYDVFKIYIAFCWQVSNGSPLSNVIAYYNWARYPDGRLPPAVFGHNNLYIGAWNQMNYLKFYAQYYTRLVYEKGMSSNVILAKS